MSMSNEQEEWIDPANQIAQSIPPLPSPDIGSAFLKMFLSLLVLILLLIISYRFLKRFMQNRFQKGSSAASIQILEKKMISPKTMLYVIKIDRKKILVAESHLDVRRLESFEIEKDLGEG